MDIEKDLNDLITDIQTQVEFCELNEGAILEKLISASVNMSHVYKLNTANFESERTMQDQELTKTLDELNAVILRKFLSKKKQEKWEKFYDAQIKKLRKKADKILEKEDKKNLDIS